jgi:hypothetical protein
LLETRGLVALELNDTRFHLGESPHEGLDIASKAQLLLELLHPPFPDLAVKAALGQLETKCRGRVLGRGGLG